ncbi:MAG TPA: response regulator [Verrucomicrobiae bacterium]|nr:response regulator [Verrucomicrobiae bacterium]
MKKGEPRTRVIYVVDDEPMLLELITVILEPLGYQVKGFRDPASALESFRDAEMKPALIITDYSMHNMTGIDLIKACRVIEPGQLVLMASGTVGEDIFRNTATKPDSFLPKPYHAKQLTETIEALLNQEP